ncbi:MAG TPA: NADH:ubiquinone oxidoreductase, partial [Isosphaeraceae bacterium]|nr:NADH:ubiquinone oxidoreductase [Isosphaeraceae bacterium]
EKAGCYVNAAGRLQYSEAALPPRDGSLPDLDILAILLGQVAGPVRSAEILAKLASAVPAFAGFAGGKVPPLGLPLGKPESNGAGPKPYNDPWTVHRFLKGDRPGEPSHKGAANA